MNVVSYGNLWTIIRSIVEIELITWKLAGITAIVSGVLVLGMQLYGYYCLGFWAPLTPAAILQSFNMHIPTLPGVIVHELLDMVFHMSLSLALILGGFQIVALAAIVRQLLDWSGKIPLPVRPLIDLAKICAGHNSISFKATSSDSMLHRPF